MISKELSQTTNRQAEKSVFFNASVAAANLTAHLERAGALKHITDISPNEELLPVIWQIAKKFGLEEAQCFTVNQEEIIVRGSGIDYVWAVNRDRTLLVDARFLLDVECECVRRFLFDEGNSYCLFYIEANDVAGESVYGRIRRIDAKTLLPVIAEATERRCPACTA